MTDLKKNARSLIAWSFYDWACSAFATIITTFIFATYFATQVAENKITGTYQWAFAAAIAGLIIAICSPIFGAIADYGGRHKRWLLLFTALCAINTGLLWFSYPSVNYVFFTLTCFILATIGMEIGSVFYNSFLPFIAPADYIGRISGWAWGLGYIGGIIALSIALFAFVKGEPAWLDKSTFAQIRICGPLTAVWLIVFSLPLFLLTPDTASTGLSAKKAISRGFAALLQTLKMLPSQKSLLLFFIAHMIYVDGLNTLFAFGGIYAAGTFGMNLTQVIIFGISLNVTAGLGAALFAWVDDRIGSKPTILISLACLFLLGIPIIAVKSVTTFWILTLCLGIFVGPVQAASRSLLVRLVPKEKATEMFGLYAFSGRITSFIGPWLLGLATYHFQSQRAGMATILLFFVVGAVLLWRVKEEKNSPT